MIVSNTVVYGGQAIMNAACATGCHSSRATGRDRRGVPAGLDFDLFPIDEEEAAGLRKSGGRTTVRLKSAQIAGLRARQEKIVENRDVIWQQVQDGLMPPSGLFESLMGNIFSSNESAPCKAGKAYSKLKGAETREVLRNWLACGAPLVETSSAKLEEGRTAGAAGYQYRACFEEGGAVVTLESLFKSTLSECGGCHNSPLTGPPSFLSVDVLAKSLRTKSECGGKPFVTPGKPERSYLLDLLEGPNPACNHERMPKGGLDPLSDRAIAEISDWIAAGAPTTMRDVASMASRSDDDAESGAGAASSEDRADRADPAVDEE